MLARISIANDGYRHAWGSSDVNMKYPRVLARFWSDAKRVVSDDVARDAAVSFENFAYKRLRPCLTSQPFVEPGKPCWNVYVSMQASSHEVVADAVQRALRLCPLDISSITIEREYPLEPGGTTDERNMARNQV